MRCGYCSDARSEEQQRAYRERQRQMELAAQRGQMHVGAKLGSADIASRAAEDAPVAQPKGLP